MIKKDQSRDIWIVQYSVRNKATKKVKTLRRIARTESAARTLERQLKEEVLNATRAMGDQDMSWGDLLRLFFADLENRDYAQATIENYRSCLVAHTKEKWAHRKISSITTQEIRDLVRVDLVNKSRSHQKSVLKFVRAVFNFATESRFLDRSPVPKMQFRIGTKFKTVLTENQAVHLLTKAREYGHEWFPIWMCAIYLGCRNEELYPLCWANVDLARRLIRIVETWTKKDGLRDLTKTGEDRVVEIPLQLLVVLQEMSINKEHAPYVLPRIDEWAGGRQAEVLRMFLLGLNLPSVNFHALRATWATIMLTKGVELAKVMKLGGWKSIKTLNEHYLRQTGIEIRGASDKMVLKAENPE